MPCPRVNHREPAEGSGEGPAPFGPGGLLRARITLHCSAEPTPALAAPLSIADCNAVSPPSRSSWAISGPADYTDIGGSTLLRLPSAAAIPVGRDRNRSRRLTRISVGPFKDNEVMGEMMDDTTPSAALARQVRDQILFKPDTHQQDVAGMGDVVGTVELDGRHL
jgi:hypothetical protein